MFYCQLSWIITKLAFQPPVQSMSLMMDPNTFLLIFAIHFFRKKTTLNTLGVNLNEYISLLSFLLFYDFNKDIDIWKLWDIITRIIRLHFRTLSFQVISELVERVIKRNDKKYDQIGLIINGFEWNHRGIFNNQVMYLQGHCWQIWGSWGAIITRILWQVHWKMNGCPLYAYRWLWHHWMEFKWIWHISMAHW